ncbi:MAG: flagellar hook-basal body complex protein FliE [Gammaproteobacteria bacterium]|nr:MAG: flagellar hook-basal body complex protein FliE [Gammaproteobacteria bacterium]
MIDTEITRVLSQMRALSAEIQGQPATPSTAPSPFGDLLRQSIEAVNEQHTAASTLAARFESGAADVSVAEVMISMQKASLSFQAMTEVRNRLVEAYQQVMNMPI